MHDDLLEQAREAAYLPPDAPPVWDLIEVMGRAWMGEAQGVEAIAADYLAHHRKAWAHVARIEGAHPWAALEARILACPELPLPLAERSEPDSIRSACALWRAALEGGDLREGVTLDEEARWRVWLCAWVGGFEHNEEIHTPKTVAQIAQQCFIRIPDRIVTHFGLRRWQISLGFEV